MRWVQTDTIINFLSRSSQIIFFLSFNHGKINIRKILLLRIRSMALLKKTPAALSCKIFQYRRSREAMASSTKQTMFHHPLNNNPPLCLDVSSNTFKIGLISYLTNYTFKAFINLNLRWKASLLSPKSKLLHLINPYILFMNRK